jgi:amino acid transporter
MPTPILDRVHAPETGSPPRPALIRAIGRWDLTAAVVNGIIGSAIFGLPGTLAALTGDFSPLVAVVAGLGMLSIVLCMAEVASRFDEQGGPYLYTREAFGPLVGFQIGWLFLWTRALSAAANFNLLATYLGQLLPGAESGTGRVVTLGAVAATLAAINVLGVRQSTWAINAFTVAKLAPIVLLIVLGLPQVDAQLIAGQAVTEPDWTEGVLILMFALGGFETALVAAGEQRDPRRDAARALVLGVSAVALIYALVQLVVIGVVPAVGGEQAPFARALEALVGETGLLLAAVAAVVSVFGWGMLSVMQAPRMMLAMAQRGELPAPFAIIHPRRRTPQLGIVVFAGVVFAVACMGSFAQIAVLSAIVRLVYYVATCAALPVLRRRQGAAPFTLPLAMLLVPVAISFCVWLLSTRSFTQAWMLLGLMAAGVPFYWRSRSAAR